MQPLLARDLMKVGVPTCKTSALVREVARYLIEHDAEEMVVLDDVGQALGVVGFHEIIAHFGRDALGDLTAEDIMKEGLVELGADLPIETAAQILRDRQSRVGYMLHDAAGIMYPAAFLSYRHLLRLVGARDAEDLKDLGLAAERKSPLAQFAERRDAARRKAGLADKTP